MVLSAALLMLFNVVVSWHWNFYTFSKRDLALQLLAESHGVVLEILIVGVLMVWINTVTEKKKSRDQAIGEIEDLRYQEGQYVQVRILRNVKTLQRLGITVVDLHAVYLPACNFRLYDLTGAVLSGMNATRGHFQGCTLQRANLATGDFTNADFNNADLSFVNAQHASFENAYLISTKLDDGSLESCSFKGAKITGSSFIGANLTDAIFDDASMFRVDFTAARGLTKEQLRGVKRMVDCIFDPEFYVELQREELIKNGAHRASHDRPELQIRPQTESKPNPSPLLG